MSTGEFLIYLVSLPCNINLNYDSYDSFVVAARSDEEARLMHPNGGNLSPIVHCKRREWIHYHERDLLVVEKIGLVTTERITEPTVLLASFNAG